MDFFVLSRMLQNAKSRRDTVQSVAGQSSKSARPNLFAEKGKTPVGQYHFGANTKFTMPILT